MFHILTTKKLKEIEREVYYRALAKGIQVGFQVARQLDENAVCIVGREPESQVDREIEQILKEKGVR